MAEKWCRKWMAMTLVLYTVYINIMKFLPWVMLLVLLIELCSLQTLSGFNDFCPIMCLTFTQSISVVCLPELSLDMACLSSANVLRHFPFYGRFNQVANALFVFFCNSFLCFSHFHLLQTMNMYMLTYASVFHQPISAYWVCHIHLFI